MPTLAVGQLILGTGKIDKSIGLNILYREKHIFWTKTDDPNVTVNSTIVNYHISWLLIIIMICVNSLFCLCVTNSTSVTARIIIY